MESATTMKHSRPEQEEQIECWDDDDDLQFNDQFRTASSTGSVTGSSFRPSGHRDSISSRRSARSDMDSNIGDEDWQVPLHDHDEAAKEEALASAKQAGIPIPANIPSSALLGGAIKRLSTRKTKRNFVDDWSEDVELPGPDVVLQLRNPQDATFPDSIRQINSTVASPIKSTASFSWNDDITTRLQSALATLDRFQDENDGPMGEDVPTLKIPAPRSPHKLIPNMATGILPSDQETADFDQDLELPPDQQVLQLSHRKDTTRISSPTLDDFDLEWSEGSIGVRVGGTARDARSIPSSTISIASPSVSSCITGESEEDGLDGLVFPDGPLDFNASLKRREETISTENAVEGNEVPKVPKVLEADDFFAGIEVDNGRVFASNKLTLNPNVKCKTEWPASPTRRSATTLTFTTPDAGTSATTTTTVTGSPRQTTRIPRLSGHERTLSTHLETVSESGAPVPKFQRSQSRLGHASQSSISSLASTDPISSSPNPVPSTRRLLGSRTSRNLAPAQNSPSAAPTRLLRTKRSLPTIRGSSTSTPTQSVQRTPPHPDGYTPPSALRPRTPVERTIPSARTSIPRVPASFGQVIGSERQPHHPNIKTYRPSRRHNSDSSNDLLSPQRTSLPGRSSRNESFRLSLDDSKMENALSTNKRTMTRPTRRRNFGDGTELESFDDLPTSVTAESKFTKNPAGRGAPRSVRHRVSQSRATPTAESPTPSFPSPLPSKTLNSTPRFARDTNASRNAREQRIASMNSRNREGNPLSTFTSNWKANPITRISPNAAPVRSRKRSNTKSQSKAMSNSSFSMKGGWHPKGKDGKSKESWRGDFKGINQVAGWMGKGKDANAEENDHVSRPLSTLKDPSSFGPPPKHVNYHGPAALPNETTPDRRGLGAPLSREHIEQQRAQQQEAIRAEEEAAQKPKPPPVPYRVNTTGLSTNNLPPPPVRRLDSPSSEAPSSAKPPTKPKPQLPPRLPPRTGSPAQTPSPPPAYSAVTPPPSQPLEGYVNQEAASRLGNSGVSVPALGIGETTRAAQPSPSGNDASINELQSRFSQVRTNSGSSSPAPEPPTRASRPTRSVEGLAPLPGFRDRHAGTIDAGKKKFGGMTSRINTFVEDRKFSANANKRMPRPVPNSPVKPASPRASPGAAPSQPTSTTPPAPAPAPVSLEAQARKKPPPPPPKRAEMRAPPTNNDATPVSSSAPAPPPVPLSTKPR